MVLTVVYAGAGTKSTTRFPTTQPTRGGTLGVCVELVQVSREETMSDTKTRASYWLLFLAWALSQSDTLATVTTGEQVALLFVAASLIVNIIADLRQQED